MDLKASQKWITALHCEIYRETIIFSHIVKMTEASTSFCHLALKKNGFQLAIFLSKAAAQFLRNQTGNFPAVTSHWVTRVWDRSGKSVSGFFCTVLQAVSLMIKDGQSSHFLTGMGFVLGTGFPPAETTVHYLILNSALFIISKMLSRIKSWILPGKLQHNYFISFSLEDQLLLFPWEWSLRPVPLASEVCCSWSALLRMFSPVPFIMFLFQILLLWAHVNLLKNHQQQKSHWF